MSSVNFSLFCFEFHCMARERKGRWKGRERGGGEEGEEEEE